MTENQMEHALRMLEEDQAKMKAVNAYYREHKMLKDCPVLSPAERRELMHAVDRHHKDKPFTSYELSNNLSRIRSMKAKLERMEKQKNGESLGTIETAYDGFVLRENVESMRLQLVFDTPPDMGLEDVLRQYGFHWSPKAGAWQRMLTDAGREAAKDVIRTMQAGGEG